MWAALTTLSRPFPYDIFRFRLSELSEAAGILTIWSVEEASNLNLILDRGLPEFTVMSLFRPQISGLGGTVTQNMGDSPQTP